MRELERGPAVAEQIVGRAKPRRRVLPVRHVVDLRKVHIARRNVRSRADMLRRHVRIEVVEADAEVQRQTANRPLVLREEAHVGAHDRIERQRRGKDRHPVRHAGHDAVRAKPAEQLVGRRVVHDGLRDVARSRTCK